MDLQKKMYFVPLKDRTFILTRNNFRGHYLFRTCREEGIDGQGGLNTMSQFVHLHQAMPCGSWRVPSTPIRASPFHDNLPPAPLVFQPFRYLIRWETPRSPCTIARLRYAEGRALAGCSTPMTQPCTGSLARRLSLARAKIKTAATPLWTHTGRSVASALSLPTPCGQRRFCRSASVKALHLLGGLATAKASAHWRAFMQKTHERREGFSRKNESRSLETRIREYPFGVKKADEKLCASISPLVRRREKFAVLTNSAAKLYESTRLGAEVSVPLVLAPGRSSPSLCHSTSLPAPHT